MKYKNRLTSLIGTIVILGAVVTVFMGKADWLSAGAAITIGSGFLLSKDHDK